MKVHCRLLTCFKIVMQQLAASSRSWNKSSSQEPSTSLQSLPSRQVQFLHNTASCCTHQIAVWKNKSRKRCLGCPRKEHWWCWIHFYRSKNVPKDPEGMQMNLSGFNESTLTAWLRTLISALNLWKQWCLVRHSLRPTPLQSWLRVRQWLYKWLWILTIFTL